MLGTLILTLNIQVVRATGSIFINADGSVTPSDAPILNVGNYSYTLTDDINATVSIRKGFIVFDGAGHTINGSGTGGGVVVGRANVTVKNTTIENFEDGIYLSGSASSNCTISANVLRNNIGYGILLWMYACNCTISDNIMTGNVGGICLFQGNQNCVVSGNYISNNVAIGIDVASTPPPWPPSEWSVNNTIARNSIVNNSVGLSVFASPDNTIYHNDFINNADSVLIELLGYANKWDEGYPLGGNYWSDYLGSDLYHGPLQNETGSDEIGDVPYTIDAYNIDNYPVMSPTADIAVKSVTLSRTVVAQGRFVNFTIVMANEGLYSENFNASVYANTTLIASVADLALAPLESIIVKISWNTSGFARAYIIGANVTRLEGETDLSDNTLLYGIIKVSCLGDINGDYVTDAKDYQVLKKLIPSTPSSPNWNPNGDLNDDLVIDAKDYQILKNHIPSILP